MVSMNRTSSLLLLCSFCSGAVVSTLTSNTTLSGEHKTACRESEIWTAPQWPPSVTWNCRRIIERLRIVEPESRDQDGFVYEFLPRGQRTRRPESEVVRTPWKLTDGTNFFLFFFPPSSHGSSSLQCHVKYSLTTLAAQAHAQWQ